MSHQLGALLQILDNALLVWGVTHLMNVLHPLHSGHSLSDAGGDSDIARRKFSLNGLQSYPAALAGSHSLADQLL